MWREREKKTYADAKSDTYTYIQNEVSGGSIGLTKRIGCETIRINCEYRKPKEVMAWKRRRI